jgi:hypothetical protein
MEFMRGILSFAIKMFWLCDFHNFIFCNHLFNLVFTSIQ